MVNEKRLIDFETARKNVMNILAGKISTPVAIKVSVAMQEATMDAVEVAHGEWTVIEDDWNEETIYQCSACKEEFVTIDGTPAENLWNYCPNCGAKMDGDGNG